MKRAAAAAALLLPALGAAAPAPWADLAPGVWSNEEQVYFAREAGRPVPEWLSLRVAADGITRLNAYGAPDPRPLPPRAGLELRAARPWRCWAAIPRRAAGAADAGRWWGARDLPLHDQGGRVALITDEAPPQRFTLKLRQVVWPSGPNQPALVLYVHGPEDGRPGDGGPALAYAWADPGARRVGINLRTVQASCSLAP